MAFGRVMMFVFRFAQTAGSRYLRLLSNMKFYFLCYIIFQFFVFSFILLPLSLQTMYANQIRKAMQDVDPKLFSLIANEPLVLGINVGYFWGISALDC